MNNIQRLAQEGNKNHRIFTATVIDLMQSQGFYGRCSALSTKWTSKTIRSSMT